jgi:general secretion pathway protein G
MQGNTATYDQAAGVTRRGDRRGEAGFTLMELLVVLIILGLIAAFAVPQVIKFVGGAKTDSARIQIERLSGVLDLYRLEEGHYPSEEEGLDVLVGGSIRKAESLIDPWGQPYLYRFPGEYGDYDLYTLGADGQEGGEGEDQDLTSW